jgi:hypothetical protein
LGERPDIFVISTGLLSFDWYRNTLQTTYPSLLIPEHTTTTWQLAIIDANTSRPVCVTSVIDDEIVFNCKQSTSFINRVEEIWLHNL